MVDLLRSSHLPAAIPSRNSHLAEGCAVCSGCPLGFRSVVGPEIALVPPDRTLGILGPHRAVIGDGFTKPAQLSQPVLHESFGPGAKVRAFGEHSGEVDPVCQCRKEGGTGSIALLIITMPMPKPWAVSMMFSASRRTRVMIGQGPASGSSRSFECRSCAPGVRIALGIALVGLQLSAQQEEAPKLVYGLRSHL